MRNNQPIEKPDYSSSETLDVQEIFRTIQGEGPYAGWPAVFVRTAGCNLQCPQCDSDYTSHRTRYKIAELVSKLEYQFQQHPLVRELVVITGGEPFRQYITPFVEALLDKLWLVQIETNGTLHLPGFPYERVCIVCSPKTPTINRSIPIHAYKYVLDADHVDPCDGLPTSVLGQVLPDGTPMAPARRLPDADYAPTYLQPADVGDPMQNDRNVKAVVDSCLKYGYICCLQTQKILGLP